MSPKESNKIVSAFKAEHKRLLGYIRKKVRNGPDAEDILQDIFYKLTVGFNDIRRIESLTAWLYKVADNRITDRLRKRKNEALSYSYTVINSEDEPLTLEEILPSAGTSPADEELKEMIWMTIEETLSELPEEQRSVFVENEFEDINFKEISEKTGVAVNTLISRKRYAVLALRKNLKELYKLFNTY